jgi:hypothetical protein
MANRRLNQFMYSYSRMPVKAFVKVTFGASGAPTLTTNPLVSGVTRNSAGDYTLTFRDKFVSLLGVKHVFNTNSGTAPASPLMWVRTDSVAAASPLLRIVFSVAAGTATDPASGEVVLLELSLNNSSVTI